MDAFHDRTSEIDRLNAKFASPTSELIVVYGRRRIGKTRLLQHWMAQLASGPHFHWTAHRTSSDILLAGFSEALRPLLPEVAPGFRFADWEAAIGQLFQLAQARRVAAVIDEFPYLVEAEPQIPSLLQKLWDQHKAGSRLVLVLCGSHYHMMHAEFASRQRPLYGRATDTMVVEEIPPGDLRLFLPRYSADQLVETYSVLGGIPAYLGLWDDRAPVMKNIEQRILSGRAFFAQEAFLLVQDEIAEPRTYLALLEALGARRQAPVDLARATGIAINHIGKYLRTLLDLRFVRRVLSEDAADRARSRITRYEIRDPFLRFHFEFLYPNSDLVQQGRIDRLKEIIAGRWDAFVGATGFEELARRKIAQMGDAGGLPFVPEHVGRAWSREAELDVAAPSARDRAVLVGECKWRRERMNLEVLRGLQARAEKFETFEGWKKHYALFARGGFTAELSRAAAAEGALLFAGADLVPAG
jgi:uncharacterized protein